MPIFILMLVLQVGLAVHCVRTQRDSGWLYFILLVPLVGGLTYFITQVLPDLGSNRQVRKAASSLQRSLDPRRSLRQRMLELKRSDNFDNRLQLAEECMSVGFYVDAEKLFRSCLSGMHRTEPVAMLGLARAQFEQEKFKTARATLDELIQANPEFRSQDGHLLYARTLESIDSSAALEEYAALVVGYAGEEAKVRYAQLLASTGDSGLALQVINDIEERVRLAPPHYAKAQAQWLTAAAKLKSRLEA